MPSNLNASAVITAQNTFTAGVKISPAPAEFGLWIVYAAGAIATVTLQRSRDDGVTWNDVEVFTASVQRNGRSESANTLYRVGVKTGDFTMGTVSVALTQG